MKASIANKDGCLGLEVSVSFGRMTDERYSGTYRCAVCGEENETFVDPSAGLMQSYEEHGYTINETVPAGQGEAP